MKRALLIFILLGKTAGAQPHHPPHNMVLYGENEVFASHIVYKRPHNYEVILKLNLDYASQNKYLGERRNHPKDTFIYLLDSSMISEIRSAWKISGTVFRTDAGGKKFEVIPRLELAQGNFDVLYFEELPLSLE